MSAKQNKIRVLHIITNLPIGGAQDNTLLTVERHDREKYEISLLCAPNGRWLRRAEQIQDVNLILLPELTRRIHFVKDIIAFWKILRILQKGKFDVVHTHSSKPGFHGRVAAKLSSVPVIVHTIHGFSFNDYMRPLAKKLFINIERLLSKITDKIITVSTLNLEKAVKLRLARRDKFQNVYSGIDFGKFDVKVDIEAKKRELGIINGEKIVGMVGRFSPQKSPADFLKAIPKVLVKRKDVRVVLVGDGDLRKPLMTLCRELGIESKVMFLGFRDDIPEVLQTFDIYVLTSLWEGLGRSLTEAMYTGRPVVATKVEGVPELVRNNETGILVQPGDVNGISEGILSILSDEKKARRLGKAAKQRITESFNADVMVRQLEKLYDQLLDAKTS